MWTLLYRDQWVPVWPNLEASLVWAAPVTLLHLMHRKRLKHISARLGEMHGRLADLHEQLTAPMPPEDET